MPCAPVCESRAAYWSKFTACCVPDRTSVLFFQLYESDAVPPGKRTRSVPTADSRPGTAVSVNAPSYVEPLIPIAVPGTVANVVVASTLTVAAVAPAGVAPHAGATVNIVATATAVTIALLRRLPITPPRVGYGPRIRAGQTRVNRFRDRRTPRAVRGVKVPYRRASS